MSFYYVLAYLLILKSWNNVLICKQYTLYPIEHSKHRIPLFVCNFVISHQLRKSSKNNLCCYLIVDGEIGSEQLLSIPSDS